MLALVGFCIFLIGAVSALIIEVICLKAHENMNLSIQIQLFISHAVCILLVFVGLILMIFRLITFVLGLH